jgi:hypothetical protein
MSSLSEVFIALKAPILDRFKSQPSARRVTVSGASPLFRPSETLFQIQKEESDFDTLNWPPNDHLNWPPEDKTI